MNFVVVNTNTWRPFREFSTLSAAKRSATACSKRAARKASFAAHPVIYEAMSVKDYAAGDYLVETVNILNPSAGPIMIRRSEKGTCNDPGTETYHCM